MDWIKIKYYDFDFKLLRSLREQSREVFANFAWTWSSL